ncbi:TPA: U32 family peptidase [Candidatus Woesearchaeota archaeon]|nr:U32 family peptidase [Candidatus Woesearchaeota archaeon]
MTGKLTDKRHDAADKRHNTRLLAPAGDWPSLRAAVEAGADEIYLGLNQLSMRAFAKNFDIEELPEAVDFCHEHNVKVNLTVNTIIYDDELCCTAGGTVRDILSQAKEANVDAVICWDFAIIDICKELDIPVHISTQASVANSLAAMFYQEQGAERIIFARELSIEQIRTIKNKLPDIEVEVFCHGAMCVSVSGRCFMSQEIFGKSANRGECIQACRREYTVKEYALKDIDREFELELGNDYVMSPKDLCTLGFLEQLTPVADVIKIEGRMRSPEYVKTVTEAYRSALDAIKDGKYTEDLRRQLIEKVKTVYNRGFSSGFFLGKPVDAWTDAYGSKATTQKIFIGPVKNYFETAGAAEVHVQSDSLTVGDTIMFQGNKTGVFEQKLTSMQVEGRSVDKAVKGQHVGIKTDRKVRQNDKVFVIREVAEAP